MESDERKQPASSLLLRLVAPLVWVAIAFALRLLLTPITGTGAPFVLFFGGVLVTALFMGRLSALIAALVSAPLAAYAFVFRAGYTASQSAAQATLYFLESLLVVYLANEVREARLRAEVAARREHRAAQLRDDLVAMVSHDLRSPLSSIQLGVELIARNVASGDLRAIDRGSASVLRSTARMSKLIDDLLDVARVEAGQLEVRPTSVQIDVLLHEAVDQLRPIAEAKSIALETTIGTRATVWCEAARVMQVLTNLIANAIKFSRSGTRVRIRAFERGDGVEVEVADEGPGLGPDELAHVFDRFWQEPKAARRHGGSGLGLAIAKGLVEAHGGRIWARSTKGEGTSFVFTIPTAPDSIPSTRQGRFARTSANFVS